MAQRALNLEKKEKLARFLTTLAKGKQKHI